MAFFKDYFFARGLEIEENFWFSLDLKADVLSAEKTSDGFWRWKDFLWFSWRCFRRWAALNRGSQANPHGSFGG